MDTGNHWEFIFLGTGPSQTVPDISCLLTGRDCKACKSALNEAEFKTLLIDCGKTFYQSALQYFPRNGIKKIDAILLTHSHCDAMYGLDDLRSWTTGGVQESIDIYCSQTTFVGANRAFPYITKRVGVSGGTPPPNLKFHIIEDQPFQVCGITITPFPVHHGWLRKREEPLICTAFLLDRTLLYMSGVSDIPEFQHQKLVKACGLGTDFQGSTDEGNGLPILIIETLRLEEAEAHLGIGKAVTLAYDLNAHHTFLTGISDTATHEDWLLLTKTLGNPKVLAGHVETSPTLEDNESFLHKGLQLIDDYIPLDTIIAEAKVIIPAFDGLKLRIEGNTVSEICKDMFS